MEKLYKWKTSDGYSGITTKSKTEFEKMLKQEIKLISFEYLNY